MLPNLEDELDAMLSDWTEALLANLDDPIVQEQLTLLDSEQRGLVSEFIASRTLPDDLDHGFIHGVRTLLSGLTKVAVATEDIRQALLSGGSPATIDEMTTRFGDYRPTERRARTATRCGSCWSSAYEGSTPVLGITIISEQ